MYNTREPLTPYYHPTTACFIDDNESFMAGLALVMPAHMSSVAFFDPADALDFVNRPADMPSLADRCFSANAHSSRPLFSLDTDLIEQEINIVRRFARLSVVIVDYSMPTFNGLEFCERIHDPHIGRILLTGVADEKMAVEAFNAGIIDRFISKSHPLASENISEFSAAMQNAYFRSQSEQLRRTLSLAGPVFLDDMAVAKWVRRIMLRKNFCEYYMVSEPSGLLLLTPQGSVAQMVILSDAQCEAQVTYAELHGAPQKTLRRLRNRSHVGFFLEDAADYGQAQDDEDYPWDDLLYRATALGDDNQRWYAALIASPPHNIDYVPDAVCHEAWARMRNSQRPPKASVL